jgi:CrcB protein
MTRWLGTAFPYGTLTVNVLGSFLLGGLMALAMGSGWLSPTLRLMLATGFCGGFTTYSTFNEETTRLLQNGAVGLAVVNVGATLGLCALAGLSGAWLARALLGAAAAPGTSPMGS